jgi:hypothetical protein
MKAHQEYRLCDLNYEGRIREGRVQQNDQTARAPILMGRYSNLSVGQIGSIEGCF